MPKVEGKKISTWTHEVGGENEEGLEFCYRLIDELYITSNGVKERRGLIYHPLGAPYPHVICDDHVRDVESCEFDGLVKKYSLTDRYAQRVMEVLYSVRPATHDSDSTISK